MAFFVVWVLFLSVVLVGPYNVSSTQEIESQLETEARLKAESVSGIAAESEMELYSIADASLTFTVLPGEVATKVGDTFIIQVSVANATDMYTWQVHLFFDNTILECINVSLPHDYVFSYAYTVGDALMDYNSTEFNNPLQQNIENDKGYLLIGDCLLGANQPNFNGSGGLCQIEFKAISSGSSNLTLSIDPTRFGTWYLGPAPLYEVATPIVSNSEVIVHP